MTKLLLAACAVGALFAAQPAHAEWPLDDNRSYATPTMPPPTTSGQLMIARSKTVLCPVRDGVGMYAMSKGGDTRYLTRAINEFGCVWVPSGSRGMMHLYSVGGYSASMGVTVPGFGTGAVYGGDWQLVR